MASAGPIRTIWNARRFILTTTRQRLARKYRGTWLGPAWFLLQPVLFLFAVGYIRVAVFDRSWRTPEGDPAGALEFIVALFIGLTVFWSVSEPLSRAPSLLREYSALIKNEVVPIDGLMAVVTLESLFNTGLRLLLLLVGMVSFGLLPGVQALLVPVLMVPVFALILGGGWILARLGVGHRDLEHITPPLFSALFFLSAVFYPVSDLPEDIRPLFLLNPVAFTIDSLRAVLLWQQWPDVTHLGILALVGFASVWIGWRFFHVGQGRYADAV